MSLFKIKINSYVKYKGVEYNVISPGEFLKDEKGYLLDQLSPKLQKMGRYRSVYLKKVYNLTEYDYYIIVMYLGNEDLIPICEYEGCNNKKQFNHLLATKKEPIFELGCCSKHTRILINRISGKRLVEEGRSPILKALAAPITEERRRKSRENALKQVSEGRHPWQKENRCSKIAGNPVVQHNMGFEDFIAFERDSYKAKGNLDDQCCLYITFLTDKEMFKIGVTNNLNNRAKYEYHGLKYVNPVSILDSTREIVSELEYSIKLHFKSFIVLGTETFSIKIYQEVVSYINSEIDKLNLDQRL